MQKHVFWYFEAYYVFALCALSFVVNQSYGMKFASCCSSKYAIVDCTSAYGAEMDNGVYQCYDVQVVAANCLMAGWLYNDTAIYQDGVTCSSACGRVDTCTEDWAWEAVLGMMVFSSTFLFCSAVCINGERNRRRKGLTMAQAYSLPLGIPVLLSSVMAAVGGNGSIARERKSSDIDSDISIEEDMERRSLIAEACDDGGQYGSVKWESVPIAKLADENYERAYAHAVQASLTSYLMESQGVQAIPPREDVPFYERIRNTFTQVASTFRRLHRDSDCRDVAISSDNSSPREIYSPDSSPLRRYLEV